MCVDGGNSVIRKLNLNFKNKITNYLDTNKAINMKSLFY